MDNCLKRREQRGGHDMVEVGKGDQERFLPEDRSQSHDFCLISPYKRLRVEELAHSSLDSQSGEGEAHSLLRSIDDDYCYLKSSDYSNESYHNTGGHISDEEDSNQTSASEISSPASPRNHDHRLVPKLATLSHHSDAFRLVSTKLASTDEGYSQEDRAPTSRASKTEFVSPRKEASSRLQRDSVNCIAAPQSAATTSSQPTNIDEICMENRSTNLILHSPTTSDHADASPRSRPYDHLYLAAQRLADCRPGMSPGQHSSHPLRTNAQSADSGTRQRFIDLLQARAGSVQVTDGLGGGAESLQSSSELDTGPLSCEDEDHYETIDDDQVSPINHMEVAAGPFADIRDFHNSQRPREAMTNEFDYFQTRPGRSAGTSCSNAPSSGSRTVATTTLLNAELVLGGRDSGDYNSRPTCGTTATESVAPLLRSQKDQTGRHHEPCSNPSQGLRLSSQQELSSSPPRVDPSCSPAALVCAVESWDQVLQHYQEQHHQRMQRQHSSNSGSSKSTASVISQGSSIQSVRSQGSSIQSVRSQGSSIQSVRSQGSSIQSVRSQGSSIQSVRSQGSSIQSVRSQGSSIQSHHVEELQVHLPGRQQDQYDLHLGGGKDFSSSSRSSECLSRVDSRLQDSDTSQKLQQHSGTSQNSWSGQHSWGSSRGYPSSMALSGQSSKKVVLQSSGQLKVSAYWNVGLLTIHVIQARCLSSSWKSHCCSYVKMSLVPDESRRTRCKTRLQVNTNNPMFDEKFSLEILEEDQRKRLLISVWHKDPTNGASEFLGCMSFGVGHLLRKDLDGWYYLLTEDVGRKKHLQAHTKRRPALTTKNYQNIPQINRAVEGQERITITIARGKNGFGFSFVEEFPPKIGRVDRASPAELAGVNKGDLVIKVNEQNVSRSTGEGVAHLVKKMNASALRLELLREQHVVSTTTEITATGSQHLYSQRGVGTSTDNLYESIEDRPCSDQHKENKPSVYGSYESLTDDDLSYSQNSLPRHHGVTSTPRLFVGHKAVSAGTSCTLSKHESIHRLMSLELDYIDFMHYGIERYSRPLRHSILSAPHHMTIFQNVEKLVTISEYHIKQMQENNSSINSDTDDSQSSESSMFPNSVALIYHSKIHMLSQAYEDYSSGLSKSNTLLRELRRNQDFMYFIKEPDFADEQCADHLSISAFINRPVLHIQELYAVLSEVFSSTPVHSRDFANLQQIVIKLSQCISAITRLSSAGRVESLDSLTSSQGKNSMTSLSSTCSSSEADAYSPLIHGSATSLMSVDKDVQLIQARLVFSSSVPAFQLLQEGRHFIYKGDIYRHSKGLWFKSQLILFSDILLLVSEEPGGSLCVTNKPIRVQDLTGIEVHRKYVSEFVLYLQETTSSILPRRQQSSSAHASSRAITLRAPSSQEKFMWKSLIEQRVATFSGGRLQHYGSMRDISHVKTSIIL